MWDFLRNNIFVNLKKIKKIEKIGKKESLKVHIHESPVHQVIILGILSI